MMAQASEPINVDAVAFDLLTALIDSWTLWETVAGDVPLGRSWRQASLRLITAAGAYVAYEEMVRRAAREVGVDITLADAIIERWGELKPWPEAPDMLEKLQGRRLAIVTNCSQRLAEIAAAATGGQFEVIMSAERAGVYKTDRRAYQAGLDALGLPASRVLFVAGSAHDVPGAGALGMPVYWSNRQRLPIPEGPAPIADLPDLSGLPKLLGVTG
ncbi:MAG: HAD-IA family hydrolase [Chloroflexota bacterium]